MLVVRPDRARRAAGAGAGGAGPDSASRSGSARVMISPDVGIVAGLMLAASPGVFGLARYAILDTLFTMFMFGGAALLAVAALRDRPRLQWPGYVAIALGRADQGTDRAGALRADAGARDRAVGRPAAALARRCTGSPASSSCWSIAAPWFVYMYVRFRGRLRQRLLPRRKRPAVRDEPVREPAAASGSTSRFSRLGLLPWTALVIGRAGRRCPRAAARRAARRRRSAAVVLDDRRSSGSSRCRPSSSITMCSRRRRRCACCARGPGRMSAGPAAASARRIARRRVARRAVPRRARRRCGYFLVARLDLPPLAMSVPFALTLAGDRDGRDRCVARADDCRRIPWLAIVALMVTYIGLVRFVMPAIERQKVVPDMAAWVAGEAGPDAVDRQLSPQPVESGVPFLRRTARRVPRGSRTKPKRSSRHPEPFYCLMRRERAATSFVARGIPLDVRLERDGMWATSGRVLWRTSHPARAVRRRRPSRGRIVSACSRSCKYCFIVLLS